MKKANSLKQVGLSLLVLAALICTLNPFQAAQAAGTWSWSNTSPMNDARSNHTSTLLPGGLMLVTGGYAVSGYLSSTELFDPNTQVWYLAGAMKTPRANHTATLLQNNQVLAAGGYNSAGYIAKADLFNPTTRQWTATGALNAARYGHTATLLPDGKVLVTGGRGNSGILASAELYDPATGLWTATGAMSAARLNHTATQLNNGKVLVVGGYNGTNYLATAELYDPATGLWTATGSLAVGRSTHTATLLNSGKVLVAGGDNGNTFLVNASLYTPTTGTWTTVGAMTIKRAMHIALLLPTGKVLVAGGRNSGGYLGAAELFNPVNNTFTAISEMNTGRASHVAALLEDGNVMVSGGRGDEGLLNKVELYAIEKVDQTITVNTSAPAYAAYGVSFTVSATASSGLAVVYSAVGDCTNAGATFTMTSGSGTCTVKYNQPGNTSYNPAPQQTQKVSARQAAITVTAVDKTKAYGDADPALTYAITSGALVGTDKFTGALNREEGESVGKYDIRRGTLALGSNYSLTFNEATLTITKQAITVMAIGKTKVYGNPDPELTYKITHGALVGTDKFHGAMTRAAGEVVGTYAIKQGTLDLNSNYTLTFVDNKLKIVKRAITVTADDLSKVYGEADPDLTYHLAIGKLIGTDKFTGALTRDAGESVGTYAITQGTLALSSNYTLSFTNGTLTIMALPPNETTFKSMGALDGMVIETSENSGVGGMLNATGTTFRLGDDAYNRQARAILSFNTATLPDDAIVSGVVLRIRASEAPTGSNPFLILGHLLVDINNGPFSGNDALEAGDFQAAASAENVGFFPNQPKFDWYKATLRTTSLPHINLTGLTQFRLYFSIDDNNNKINDFLKFFSGNAVNSNRPELIITYTVP